MAIILGGCSGFEMEVGEGAKVFPTKFQRCLRVPNFEQATYANHQRLLDNPRTPAHHRRQDDGAIVVKSHLFAKAENPPQALRAGRRRAVFMIGAATFAVAVQDPRIGEIIGGDARIAFMGSDEERSRLPAAPQGRSHERRKDEVATCIDGAKSAPTEQMLNQLRTPTGGEAGPAALTMIA